MRFGLGYDYFKQRSSGNSVQINLFWQAECQQHFLLYTAGFDTNENNLHQKEQMSLHRWLIYIAPRAFEGAIKWEFDMESPLKTCISIINLSVRKMTPKGEIKIGVGRS